MKQLERYFTQRNDEERLQAYKKFSTANEETLNNLIHEYFLCLDCDDASLAKQFSDVIDYLFDCYNG